MFAWLSLDSIPERTALCISMPNSETWQSQFLGAFLELTRAENWEEHGTLSALEMSDEWRSVFFDFVNGACSMFPVGSVIAYAGSVAPDGWLICEGQAVSRVTYAALYTLFEVSFGVGNGSTTFNLPDLRHRVVVGQDDSNPDDFNFAVSGGEIDHALVTGEMPVHTHTQNAHGHTQNAHAHTQDAHGHTQNAHAHTLTKQTASGSPFVSSTALFALTNLTNQGSQGTDSVTATNQNTTATNQNTTATNQNTTATNQNSGSGEPHNNMQPYLVLHYIIKF